MIKNDSSTPLDSLMALEDHIFGDEGILVFNVDAVYDYEDLRIFVERLKDSRYLANKDMIMWAASYAKGVDENPAFMSIASDDRIVEYGKDIAPCEYMFGQVRYCSTRILRMRSVLQAQQIKHMKSFIQYLIQNRYSVYAHRINNPVYDIDTPADVEKVKRIMADAELSSTH